MAKIIAGRTDTLDKARDLARVLCEQGFAHDDVETFFVNPAGQHDAFPVGGDEDADAGAERSHAGALTGAGIGAAAVGAAAAAIPGVGPALAITAAAVGAYTGSLAGALAQTDDKPQAEAAEPPPVRGAGARVAVRVQDEDAQARALRILRDHGAREIEHAEGEWRDGRWADFDPLQPPRFVDQQPGQAG